MGKIYKAFTLLIFTVFTFATVTAQECDVIYVTPTGTGTGTKASPASLTGGIALVSGTAIRIKMAAGTYGLSNTIQLANNLTIEGGFDATTWAKSNSTPTIIHRDNQNLIPSPANALVAFAGISISGFRLQDLTINVDAAPGNGNSVYGVYLNGCSNYNIVRCVVTTGAGAPGIDGTNGTNGNAGGNGQNGAAGNPNETGWNVLTPGGVGAYNGGTGAGNGRHSNGTPAGVAGGGPCGGTGGATGTGPSCSAGCVFGSPSCSSVTPGQPGGAGGIGTAGTLGAAGPAGNIALGYYVPGAAAGAGATGSGGCGGGGGGGGGGRQNSGQDDVGGAGGGGGGGGYGGNGGTGGTGGGGSFAVFLFNNGAGGNITDCALTAGAGGVGGVGGSGGQGGAGGQGGQGGAAGCGNSAGGAGGDGGAGGAGGQGGTGATGQSANLSESGGTPVTQSNISNVPGNPPVITVDSKGCTNAEVIFTSTTGGAWNFGAGASPATGNGTGPISITYNTLGRKSIVFAGTTFTDFIDIFSNQSNSSTITHTNIPAVVGCPDNFSTTITGGSLYEWDFGGAALPATATINNNQPVQMAFTAPGTYTISVWVTTTCCGRVKDSLVVTVQPNTLNVTLTASDDSICVGDPITYTATPTNYSQYTFFVNNTPAQTSASNTFTATNLQPGDSVVVSGFQNACYTNPSATHYPVVTPTPVVTLTSSDANDTICAGDAITFTATPTGYDDYTFINGGSQVQSSTSNTWTINLGQGSMVRVQVTENGCTAMSNTKNIFVNATPVLVLTAQDTSSCVGDNVVLTVMPDTLTSYDFSVNSSSVQNTSANTYSSSAFNSGDVVTVTALLNGCPSANTGTVTLTVNPIPSVTLTSSDADNLICENDQVIFTAAPAGYDSYEFFDGATSVQNGASETYTTTTLQTPNSITVVATDNGCTSPASNPIVTTITPAPVVDAGSDASSCVDAAALTLNGNSPTGGTWSGTGITDPALGEFTPSVAGAGAHSLVYTYTDPVAGCAGRDSIVYTVNALPVITVLASVDICEGQSATLTSGGGSTYTWSPATDLSNANIANPVASPAATTAYTVTVTDANNCSNTATTTVNVNPNPDADFTSTEVCEGLATDFTNNSTPAGVTSLWYFGDGTSLANNSPSHQYASTGTYQVTLVVSLGTCTDSVTNPVGVYPAVVADFTATPLVGYNDGSSPIQFNNLTTGADSWVWNFGDETNATIAAPSHLYVASGAYTITLIAANQYGCNDSITKEDYIHIYELPKVFVPNAFSPNGDGNNDIAYVYAQGTKYIEWQIFNRWGEKVFQTNNFLEGWDGRTKGKYPVPGVYVYHLKIVFGDDSNRELKGTITLLR